MGENMMSPADVAAVTGMGRNGNGFGFGNEGLWLFAILALMGGGFGNFGNRNQGNPVTEANLCNANSFSELKGSVGRLSDQVDSVNINLTKAVCDLGYATLGNFNALERQLASCCCSIERAIDQVNYNGAINTSNIIRSQEQGTQRILDYLCGQETQRLRDENMRNYIKEQFCGVVRYPMSTSFASNCNPFGWGRQCGYQNV